MKILTVFTTRVFEENGDRKIKFYPAGKLKVTDMGKHYLQLYMFPQTEFVLLEKQPKPETKTEIEE